ncbi:dynein regulatory complex protein 1 isoform X1 [Bufo bufo]|uniref:dynein regulatory complex protein 1 isoform X1 n=1 Tax=Bufo bufo TaxID=8384 RepID=UPI001ABE827C|nr:dynein regulatory complex protein 1 isoform X1 [Bufo bufo]
MFGDSVDMAGEETATPGPSVDSEDQQERIQARRLRITARIEAKRREALGEDPSSVLEHKETPRRSYKQVEDSRQRLSKLVTDGTQLVTNIQVAADGRETQRRAEEEELRRRRVEKIDNEAKSSFEKFEDVTEKWLRSGERRIAQELWTLLNSQQQHCGQLIEEKNGLIGELQQELKRKDDQYVKDLKKQGEDISLLIERMEEQVRSLGKTYREELLQTEKAFDQERRELLSKSQKKWEQRTEQRCEQELQGLMNRMKKVEEYEQQLNRLRVQDGEEYNMIKIKLETEVQILQQQLQQMKATYQLNQEKLEYNFQVLKKRDEENTITKSQQKRRITRLQDVLNNLKIKLEKQIKQCKEENQALTDDFKRIAEQYRELQKKMRHFAAVDAKKFHDIWVMNEEEMKQLVQKALEVDRIIHEQQLGLPWTAPDLWFMDNIGPLVVKAKEQKTASMLAQQVMRVSGGSHDPVTPDDQEPSDPSQPFSPRTVKQILEVLCDESGFLIENKLVQLLSPLEKDERSLIRLDTIFGALQIEVEDDVYKLVDFFLKYRQQQGQPLQDDDLGPEESDKSHLQTFHPSDLIHPNDVLRALRAFTMEVHHQREKPHLRLMGTEERDNSEDAAYWSTAAQVIPPSQLKAWDALESAMEMYYDVLTSRSQLITETSALRQQNTELRMLLHQYLNSKINAELEIPPTQILQVDMVHP